ncbi:MAG: DUF2330 domain-containing protein [Minicystis sp.]
MRSRSFLAAALAGALTATTPHAEAAGAWIGDAATPVEQRVAIAVGPARTTMWTSLRFASSGGTLAIVVPAPPGAALDLSSDAWLEALEVATAPRIFPPAGVDPRCPGASGPAIPFQIDGRVDHAASLAPEDVAVLDDAAAVASWAAEGGLAVTPALEAKLAALPGMRFVALRFSALPGERVTPTLRVVMPSAPPILPLAITQAGAADLAVTAWVLGAGRADLAGAAEIAIAPPTWSASAGSSDYDAKRADALDVDPTRFLVEAAGHGALGEPLPIAAGTASIDAVVSSYFERAAAYGDIALDSAACAGIAASALRSAAPVAASCPRAHLGTIDPAAICAESPTSDETDPNLLRCDTGADDLAVALSGLAPASAWLTRLRLVIGKGSDGVSFPIETSAGSSVDPIVQSATVDITGCTTSSSSSSTGGPLFDDLEGNGSSSGSPPAGGTSGTPGTAPTSGGGSTSSGSSGSSSSETCDCDGQAAGAAAEGCASAAGEACGEGIAEGCSSGLDDCSISSARRLRGPRFSAILMAALAVLAPLRRRGRPRRNARA